MIETISPATTIEATPASAVEARASGPTGPEAVKLYLAHLVGAEIENPDAIQASALEAWQEYPQLYISQGGITGSFKESSARYHLPSCGVAVLRVKARTETRRVSIALGLDDAGEPLFDVFAPQSSDANYAIK